MAAPIKPIDGSSIHLIQSGQVIVDLCSVVKELVENSIDSGANNIDVRFKNQGLDRIEVQDNGSGISPVNHASVALKHYTSKLSCYSDIGSLRTFGFRGEALASLCALSRLTITTCIESDVPKGYRLSFDASGELSSTALSATQRGTTVSVEALFHKLPVRRRELERNIKREWQKVIALLNQYACIQTDLKFSVSQQPTNGKRVLLFSTKGNRTTRENILNIFGSKAMSSLVPMDILLAMEPSRMKPVTGGLPPPQEPSRQVRVLGHVSRPVHGDGRQTPDRQMFFVNGRPCALPQFAKIFNEVYKSYNYSQSPFIFADIQLDTNMYDVNVSPDKRSILLHDQTSLLNSIRTSLAALFDSHEHKLPAASVLNFQPSEIPMSLLPSSSLVTKKVTSLVDDDHASTTDDLRMNGRSSTTISKIERQHVSKMTTEPGSSSVGNGQSVCRSLNHDVEAEGLPLLGVEALISGLTGLRSPEKRTLTDNLAGYMASNDSDVGNISTRASTRQDRYHELKSTTKQPVCQTFSAESDMASLDDDASSPCSSGLSLSTKPPYKKFRPSPDAEGSLGKSAILKYKKPAVIDNTTDADDEQYLSSAEAGKINLGDVQGQEADLESQYPQHLGPNSNAKTSLTHHPRGRSSKNPFDQSAAAEASISSNEARRRTCTNTQRSQVIYTSEDTISRYCASWGQDFARNLTSDVQPRVESINTSDAESKLSLMVSKNDFAKMRVVGQFNLGFIIAILPRYRNIYSSSAADAQDELLIIDQHASDEKFNFEKLQAHTVVQSQRLVHPKVLDLTALEEEIVLENLKAFEANGFLIQVNATAAAPVGSRCQLLALPLSRELTFNLSDLEDLISLLAEEPAGSKNVPRPSAVRKMFAMRACRSSIMIGKALTTTQMYTIIRHMGELDKPWNCPHGRPTMRHLCRIQAWDETRWTADTLGASTANSWASFIGNPVSR